MTHGLKQTGFTLIEVVVVIIITGILLTVAVRSGRQMYEVGKTEATIDEMNDLAIAIAGDPTLNNNGSRVEFGYVGDVGSLPPNIDALYANPGAYATWNGPYVSNRLSQNTGDYKTDAWQAPYVYSGGITITSTGSGDTLSRTLAGSVDELLFNRVTGVVYDKDGDPPGPIYCDSTPVVLIFPDGNGGWQTKTTLPDPGGYFSFDSIPIGSHDLALVYEPLSDTLTRYVTVSPRSTAYGEYYLPIPTWTGASGSLEYVPGSAAISGAPDCDNISFDVVNNTATAIDINSMIFSWSSPTAYFKRLKLGTRNLANSQNPRMGSGDLLSFGTEIIPAGATVTFSSLLFCDSPTGPCSAPANMQNTTFTITFSDGSTFDFTVGACP